MNAAGNWHDVRMETERLLLRPWTDGDAAPLYKYASDPLVGPAAGWAVHKTIGESWKILRTVLAEDHTFAVVLKETKEPVGSVGLFPGECCETGELELGYWIGRPYWGQGLIPEASRRMLEYGFRDLGCPRIWVGHFLQNDRSRRVVEKLGFHGQGYRVSVWPSGRQETTHYYVLSREEWQENAQ